MCLRFVLTAWAYGLCLRFVLTVCAYSMGLPFMLLAWAYGLCLQYVLTVCTNHLCQGRNTAKHHVRIRKYAYLTKRITSTEILTIHCGCTGALLPPHQPNRPYRHTYIFIHKHTRYARFCTKRYSNVHVQLLCSLGEDRLWRVHWNEITFPEVPEVRTDPLLF